MGNRVCVMSIKPRFADAIIERRKSYELRRYGVNLQPGQLVLIYATAPVSAIIGVCWVVDVHRDAPSALWREHNEYNQFCLARDEYDAYMHGCARASAVELHDADYLPDGPVTLDMLQERLPGFRAPQRYAYRPLGDLADLSMALWEDTDRDQLPSRELLGAAVRTRLDSMCLRSSVSEVPF